MEDILLEFMVIISPRNTGNKIIENVKDIVSFPSVLLGRGTAPNDIASALGIGEPEKDVILCFAQKKDVEEVYEIVEEMFISKTNKAIAMTVPVSAVGGNLTLQVLLGKTKDMVLGG